MKTRTHKMRAAHASFSDGRFIVISVYRVIRSDANGAQIIISNTRRTSPKIKATIKGTHAVLEGKRAA